MKKILLQGLLLFCFTATVHAQGSVTFRNLQVDSLSIGNSASNAAIVQINSTTSGFLPPRMTSTQRDAILAPVDGLIIFNTTSGCHNYYSNGIWYAWCGTSTALSGAITALDCSTATSAGTLTSGTAASGVSASVPYTGGNGGTHSGQTVTSTGVTGLSATLAPGTFATGSDTVIYTITGTPASNGTASFALNLGGQTCTLTRTVNAAAPSYPAGTVHCSSPTAVVEVTNPTTGKIWMDRNLGASQAATSSTDATSYGDLYQWGRSADGHQCRNSATTSTLSSTDTPGHGDFILAPNSPWDWRSPQNTNLWQGVNGTNNPCPSGYRLPTETEFSAERASWSGSNSAGAFASPLKLPLAGNRNLSFGSLDGVGAGSYYWSSTVSSTSSRYLFFDSGNANMGTVNLAYGLSVRCIKDASVIPATIGALNCGSSSTTGTLTSGTAASGVSASVPYTGGNGGTHSGQTVTSTGVTGLSATLAPGTFATGSDTVIYTITGTPASNGTASFALNLGGQTCTLTRTVNAAAPSYPAGTVHCSSPTAVVEVTNPTTGKIWMDRNLGASQAATSSTDATSYGDLYQWGRSADGHQCRNSATTSTLSSTDQPGHSDFILNSTSSPFDWRSPQNTGLWQGVNGVNNPCPIGYRLPTETEINAERASWSSNNSTGAFASPLKLPMAGARSFTNGSLNDVGTFGYYLSSTVSSTNSRYLYFNSSNANMDTNFRASGVSVRCLKD